MLTYIAVVCLATLSTISAQIQVKDPSACDGDVKRFGVGFNPHPYDCSQFVQCFYLRGGIPKPFYRSCEWGQFWDHSKLRCLPAKNVICPHDKCKNPGVQYYKHSDPNKCGAYWQCKNGLAHGACCPIGQAFHPAKGCIPSPTCTDMCPEEDRVPGCARRPISGNPTRYLQYTGDRDWRTVKCPPEAAYNPADCSCSYKNIIKVGRMCKPDVNINFERIIKGSNGLPTAVDISGNNYGIRSENVTFFEGSAYFNGYSKLVIDPLRPSPKDEGVMIIKLKYKERYLASSYNTLQAVVTNGHCGAKESVMIAKMPGFVLLGADCEKTSRTFMQPTVKKVWKEIIYIHDKEKLEARVCGALKNEWAVGALKDTKCGLQFGAAEGMSGYVGLIDDIQVYRCKPLDAVINMNY